MAEDISLHIFGSASSSASTSTETLFDARRPLLNRGKVHSGYGASKIPLRPSAAGAFAGQQYDSIFQGQLGRAAADPDNPLGEALDKLFYPNRITEAQHKEIASIIEDSGFLTREELKPASLKWNKETREKYPLHWKEVRNQRNRLAEKLPKVQPLNTQKQVVQGEGVVLPFSHNIGPGNPIRPAKNPADFIAQGHDLHYKDAKKASDVLSADKEAISQFAHEAVSGQDPISRIHAAVGGIGLGIKHGIESLTGKVIYG